MENNNEISIAQALNHIQSWLNAGEFDKVIQGCQEILQIEPGNARALALMKLAEERRNADVQGKPMPEPSPMPEPVQFEVEEPTPAPVPHDPMPHVQLPPEEDEMEDHFEKRKLFLAMLIPAVLVVVLGGAAIWWLANRDREAEINDNLSDETPADELSYLEQNDERVQVIQKLVDAIEEYEEENGEYPSISKIESAIADNEEFDKIPSDPRQGEIDKAGKAFGYIYAVYDGTGGENSVYILSALFEDNRGFGTSWAEGAPIKNYPDFRDYEEDHVTFIGGDEDDVETVGKGPEDADEDGPKVNPDN